MTVVMGHVTLIRKVDGIRIVVDIIEITPDEYITEDAFYSRKEWKIAPAVIR
jgi:hypothetical protein